jgi:2-alkyl-3-oxoalkanoate reductase
LGKRAAEQKQMKVLVTGGSGFLGLALCRALLAQGHQVSSFQRSFSVELELMGVRQFLGALNDQAKVSEALQEQEAVLHNAAKASGWGAWDDFYQTNVLGTQNIIAGCQQLGIQKLVYTSTPSVVHQGRKNVAGGNEINTPYATHFSAHYPHTKKIAEQTILAANSTQLASVALRPRLIWGPGDTQLLPRLIERSKAGRLRFIGGGDNKMDCTYIDNVVQAHLLALEKCAIGAACAGKAYFISNAEPKPIREIVNGLLTAAKAPLVTRSIPFVLAYSLGVLCEGVWRLFHLNGEPPMTRFLAEQLSTEHWYDCSAAERDLGYVPKVSIADGLLRLHASLNTKVDV